MQEEKFVYPVRSLTDFYKKRRSEIRKLHNEVQPVDVLMIDALTSHMGESLNNIWEKEGGSTHYPPPCLNALLNMYLLENVDQRDKHIVVFYLLCDLLNSATEDQQLQLNEQVRRFTQAYNLPIGLSKLIQGMWLLDHKDFEDSLYYLLDPSVEKEVRPWQHTCVIKALLYHNKPKLALQYMQIRRPPLSTPEHVKLRLTVLLANGLTPEAFEYQRLSRDEMNTQDLLSHVFAGCQQTKTVDQLLLLPFSDEEEHHLVNYLKTSPEMSSQELLVLYYLLRARYVEAVRLNHWLKQQSMGDLDAGVRERARVRNSLVDGYLKVLPPIQRKLCLGPEQSVRHRLETRTEYQRPTPLSTIVNRVHHKKTLTRATLLQSVLDKVHEVRKDVPSEIQMEDMDHRKQDDLEKEEMPGPFICTPVIPRVQKHRKSLAEVVFPQTMESYNITMGGSSLPPGQRTFIRSPKSTGSPFGKSYTTGSPFQSEPSHLSNTLKRRQHLFTAEALSLLKTPPVKRRTPNKFKERLNAPVSTPHSILKSRTKTSTDSSGRQSPTKVDKFKFQAEDLELPTPPRVQRRVTLGTKFQAETVIPEKPIEVSPTVTMEVQTPKHLRFIGVSPDSSMEKSVHIEVGAGDNKRLLPCPTQRKSLRDRSPTPERLSPKILAKTDQIALQKSAHFEDSSPADKTEEPVQEIQEIEEDVMMVDEDITLNLAKNDITKTAILEPEPMEDDTEPFELPMESIVDEVQPSNDVTEKTSENESATCVISDNDPISQTVNKSNSDPVEISESESVMSETSSNNEFKSKDVVTNLNEDKKNIFSETKVSVVEQKNNEIMNDSELVLLSDDKSRKVTLDNVVNNETNESDLVLVDDEDNIVSEPPNLFDKSLEMGKKAKFVSKDVTEEGNCEEQITEISSPSQITKIIKETSFKKVVSETVEVIDLESKSSESEATEMEEIEDQVTTSVENSETDNPDQTLKPSGISCEARSTTSEEGYSKEETIKEVAADSTSQDMTEAPAADSTSTESPELLKDQPRTPTRRSSIRRRQTSESLLLTPTRRSSRIQTQKSEVEGAADEVSQTEHLNTRPGACHAHGHVDVHTTSPPLRKSPRMHSPNRPCAMCQRFKTPPRPIRVAVLPPTPPKSNASSPASTSSGHDRGLPSPSRQTRSSIKVQRSNTRSRSRSKSPTSTTEADTSMIQIKTKSKKGHGSRPSSRNSSPGTCISVGSPGPLSEDSFMMRLRSGHKVPSRETTPDSSRIPIESTDLMAGLHEEFDQPNFTFSDPVMLLDHVEEETVKRSTPTSSIPDFIFSPPITRSRRRDPLRSQRFSESSSISSITSKSGSTHATSLKTEAQSPAKNTRLPDKTSKITSKRKEGHNNVSDSPINFLSPVPEEQTRIVTRQRVKSLGSSAKATSLRPREGGIKKRKPLNW